MSPTKLVAAEGTIQLKDVWAIRVGLALSKRTVNLRADSNAIEHRFVAIGTGGTHQLHESNQSNPKHALRIAVEDACTLS